MARYYLFIMMLLALLGGCSGLGALGSFAGMASGEGPSASVEVGDDEASVGSDEASSTAENENDISNNQGTVKVQSDTVTNKETKTQENNVSSIETQENVFEDGIPWYWAIVAGVLVPFPTPRQICRRLFAKKPK
jgi:hypothetical protein